MTFAGPPTGPPDTGGFLDALSPLAEASPAVMLAGFVVALWRRWLILPRELDCCQQRVVELEAERDEWKSTALNALGVAERVTTAAERRGVS